MIITPVRHKVTSAIDYLMQLLPAITAWVFGFPFSLVVRRDPCLTVVIGRPGRTFADNSKYFFVYGAAAEGRDERIVFFTTDHDIKEMISEAGGESVLYPSLRAFYLLLRCKAIVMDWVMVPYIYPLVRGATLVQMWHGAPLKHIELDYYRTNMEHTKAWFRPLSRLQTGLSGRYPLYDLVAATSRGFIGKAFSSCFSAKRFAATGYPRNDILFGRPATGSAAYRLALVNVDKGVLETVNSAGSRGEKICLYMPTFRREMDNPFTTQIDLSRLSKFAQKNRLLFILKMHPVMEGKYGISDYPGLIEYPPLGDVYPLMPLCDLLVTDYSSIYFDFLLLDRPIIFFAYDLDRYLSHDRAMYFDYGSITPGAKCSSCDELESKIEDIIANGWDDGYAEMRKQVRSFTHDFTDNQSSRRLLESI